MQDWPAEVVRHKEDPNSWCVEKLDSDGDGGIDVTIFTGPLAKERAEEYRAWKYP
jgi:hypothetical protein